MLTLTIFIIAVALLFDFLNGMNDAANSIATVVSTRVLSPKIAVLWAAFFNFVAAFGFGVAVAKTIGRGIIDPGIVDHQVILSALTGAILWTHVCTRYGLPISVSHSLIGGLAGAGVVKGGLMVLNAAGITKVVLFIFLAPIIGMVGGFFLMVVVNWIFRGHTSRQVDGFFRFGQLLSSAAYSLGHGTNDAQKTMGIITILLYSGGYLAEFEVPMWVILSAHTAIGLGTLTGGWRVIRTMGVGLTHLKPVGGFCAETGGALVLLGTAVAGIPVSTTHTIAGAIMGVGSTRRISAVRWGVAGRIVVAWILTIPVAAIVSALAYEALSLLF
ncbi:MAG TPA: inorganic phosphate transporter [Bacteroidota bacterium]